MESHRKDDMPPSSRHSDGQPGNPSHGDGLPHHHVHPSRERAFKRAEEPVDIHHHLPERTVEEHMAETQREHAARNEHHARRR